MGIVIATAFLCSLYRLWFNWQHHVRQYFSGFTLQLQQFLTLISLSSMCLSCWSIILESKMNSSLSDCPYPPYLRIDGDPPACAAPAQPPDRWPLSIAGARLIFSYHGELGARPPRGRGSLAWSMAWANKAFSLVKIEDHMIWIKSPTYQYKQSGSRCERDFDPNSWVTVSLMVKINNFTFLVNLDDFM